MRSVRQVLETASPEKGGERVAIVWSPARLQALRRTAAGESQPASPIETGLAPALLQCAEGAFAAAERDILRLLAENLELCEANRQVFTQFLQALFTVQRLDLVGALLRDHHGYTAAFTIALGDEAKSPACVAWEIATSGEHRFCFDSSVYRRDTTGITITDFEHTFPLLAHYAGHGTAKAGRLCVNIGDVGLMPGLAFSDSRPDRFLVPDRNFIATRGYAAVRQHFAADRRPWRERQPIAFWRGATTGIRRPGGDWRSLDRIRLCELGRRPDAAPFIDAGVSRIVQFNDPAVVRQIETSGLVRNFVPWQEWDRYQFHIDIDGNTNAWTGLFYRFLTGSPVLKVESARGFVQWFYDRLIPWENYVPVSSDMSDLPDKIRWLQNNPELAESIGRCGRALAHELSYEREIARAMPVIDAAFRCFNEGVAPIGPYGRLSGVPGMREVEPAPQAAGSSVVAIPAATVTAGRDGASRAGLGNLTMPLKPAPTTLRETFELFARFRFETGLEGLFDEIDLAPVTPRQIYYAVHGRPPERLDFAVPGPEFSPLRRFIESLQSREFRDSIVRNLLDAFPERRRLLLLHIPRTAGSELSVRLMDKYPSVTTQLSWPDWLTVAEFHAAIAQFVREAAVSDSIFVRGHNTLEQYKAWRAIRFRDSVFTVLRDPAEMTVSQVNYVLTRMFVNAVPIRPDTAAWRKRFGVEDAAGPPTGPELLALAKRILRDSGVVPPNPICRFLGDGSAQRAAENIILNAVELTDISRYDAWCRSRWGIERQSRSNISKPYISLADFSGDDRDYMAALLVEDSKLYGVAQKALASRGSPSVIGAELL